jgi:nicotinate-nucleotide adenylyltransferase
MFNPPHIGHLVCAQEARWQLELDRVVLMPAGRAPHRPIEQDPGAPERLRLCRLAAAAAGGLEVSRHEVDKAEPAFTVDTLAALHAEQPDDDLVFIAGADQAARLPGWREPARILGHATMAVAERGGTTKDDVRRAIAGIEGAVERVTFFEMPLIDVSSSDVRARVAAGRPYRLLVPDAVADRIEEAGLYRAGRRARVTR